MKAFTLGNTAAYDKYMQDAHPRKRAGGSVWLTFEEALHYQEQNDLHTYSIYELELDSLQHIELEDHQQFYKLLKDAKLVCKCPS